ncbi:MAG: DNA repair protein RadC [Fuerstiella sp.]
MSVPTGNSSTVRYERYRAIVESLVPRTEFHLNDIKQACAPERPAFVSRVVRELEQDGWIVREPDGTEAGTATGTGRYRWNSGRGKFAASRWLDEKMFGTQIKVGPVQERPRERLLAHGVEALRNSELLAILIRSGRPGESALTGGEKVARAFDSRLQELPSAGRGELKAITAAVEKTAYCQIMAGIELGRRVAAVASERTTSKISSTTLAMAFCRRHFARLATEGKQEEFHIVTLDTKNGVIDTHQITVGTLDASLVHPREVFRPAIRDAAASVILVHNHPSGDPTPSKEDRAVTRRLESAGQLLGIEVLDHIVLGRDSAASLREQ